jgi:hypothetical protein
MSGERERVRFKDAHTVFQESGRGPDTPLGAVLTDYVHRKLGAMGKRDEWLRKRIEVYREGNSNKTPSILYGRLCTWRLAWQIHIM